MAAKNWHFMQPPHDMLPCSAARAKRQLELRVCAHKCGEVNARLVAHGTGSLCVSVLSIAVVMCVWPLCKEASRAHEDADHDALPLGAADSRARGQRAFLSVQPQHHQAVSLN